ncbi:MAG: 4-(cytidine 5'-diphospho)-2-C-methyl-D-erythritol kinase [Thermoleophilaceae bacterium]
MSLRERAYAKLNLILHVGPPRDADGLHPLCSLFASIDLADELEGGPAGAGEDSVEAPGVAGENLALRAIEAFRERTGLPTGSLAVRIVKRIPVAAGLGGGSADAAAMLRMLNRTNGSPLDSDELRDLAAQLGADVPSQVEPDHALVQGVGEQVERVALPPLTVVLVRSHTGLRTAEVYAELDRLGGWRERLDPEPLRRVANVDPALLAAAVENDLEAAALSLRPELVRTLARLRSAGALGAAVSGSGPTCFGLFDSRAPADAAAASIPGAIVTRLRSR